MTVYAAEKVSTRLSWDEDFHRTYNSVYQVLATKTEGPVQVANSTGIPAYGSYYNWYGNTDQWAFCKSVEVDSDLEQIKVGPTGVAGYRWFLKVIHTSKPGSSSNSSSARNNPLNDLPVISGSFNPYSRTVFKDKDDTAIKNSAGHPIDPALQVSDAYDTVSYSVNTTTIDLSFRSTMINTVNSVSMWGLPARRVKLVRWRWQRLFAGKEFSYIKNDYEFLISNRKHPTSEVCIGPTNAVGWYNTVPNQGRIFYKDGTINIDNERVFTDSADEPTGQPGWLACNGDRLAEGVAPKFNVFKIEEEANLILLPGVVSPLPNPPFV